MGRPSFEHPYRSIDIRACPSIRWRILLSGRRHAMDDGHAYQTDNAHHDPLLWRVEQVRAHGQADDQYDVPDDVDAE
jgi:hypothetical protein